MARRMQEALGLALAIALALGVGSAGAAEKIKFTQAWIPQGDVAWLWVAKAKGFWERRGLDVSIDRGYGSAEAVKNTGLGNYDYTAADFGSMIVAKSRGLDLINVGIIHHVSPKGVASLKGKGITKPKDLEGKRVVTSGGSSVTLLWPAFARANAIDVAKVQIVLTEPQLHIPTLIDGKADAMFAYYNSSAPPLWARGYQMDYIAFSAHGLPTYEYGIITTGARVKRNPDQV
ncbi:MAG: ABC transporter substrate-binding protein, partial [Deltaproteobacteria bacterium]|nr:ABC transporter substrate-binding protein [Deltaproteobacteria bacterium]